MHSDTADENERLKLKRLRRFRRTRQTQAGQLNTESEIWYASIDSLQQEFDVELNEEEVETNMPSMRPLALIENKYIVAMGLDGLYIIDFHAAHERVMYERLKDQAQFKRVGKQDLLKPISLELSKSESAAFEEILPEVNII